MSTQQNNEHFHTWYKLCRRKVNKVTLSRGRFLNLNAIDILGRMIVLLGG